MSSEDLQSNMFKGMFHYGEDKLKELIRKFNERKIAFIQKRETINLVKEQIKSGEWNLLNKYIKNKELKLFIQTFSKRLLETKNQFKS
jgi:hypothetical protein